MSKNKIKIAQNIVLDARPGGGVTIDGEAFPYAVARDGVEILGTGKDEMLAVRVTLYVENITVTDRAGGVQRWSQSVRLWSKKDDEVAE